MKFYSVENEYNKDLYDMTISAHQAQILANKITRHFKFRKVQVHANTRTRGYASRFWAYIQCPKITSVGLIIHELAHRYNNEKYEHHGHTKKLHTTIKRFSAYFRKHLKEQFSTFEQPKSKAKPTLKEKHETALKRTENNIKRLETKIKTLKTRLKTAKKKRTKHKKRLRLLKWTQQN